MRSVGRIECTSKILKKESLIILMVGVGFSLFAQSGKLSEDKRKEFEAQKEPFLLKRWI